VGLGHLADALLGLDRSNTIQTLAADAAVGTTHGANDGQA
jgi:hypothetical protein